MHLLQTTIFAPMSPVKVTATLASCLLFLTFFAGCTTPTASSSRRSLELTEARLARGGSVSVVTAAKTQGVFPSGTEAYVTRTAEAFFRSKGFSIREIPPGSDYVFLVIPVVSNYGADSATVVDNTAYLNHQFTHTIGAEFHEVNPNGTPKRLLWSGHALTVLPHANKTATQELLMEELLKKFP